VKRLTKELRDQNAHWAVTAAILAIAVFVPWGCTPAALLIAIYREDAQHRPTEGWGWILNWGTRHMDLAFGTLGGLIIDLVLQLT
jgi:hypothetical protein